MNARGFWLALLVLGAVSPAVSVPHVVRHQWKQTLERGRVVVEYAYPQVQGLPRGVQAQVNDALQNSYAPSPSRAAEWVRTSRQTDRDPVDLHHDVDYEITRLDDRIISVKYRGYEDRHPEPHPERWTHALTLDLRTGQAVTLKSLFKPEADYRTRLVDWTRKYLTGNPDTPPQGAFEMGIHFYLTPHKLVLYHVYTDYLTSDWEVPIPASELQDILAPNGLFQP